MNEEANRNRQIAASQADEGTEIDLLELFYCLLEKARFILLAGLAGALLMGFYSFYIAKPSYEATSKLYVCSIRAIPPSTCPICRSVRSWQTIIRKYSKPGKFTKWS